jgi:hypothetical protein
MTFVLFLQTLVTFLVSVLSTLTVCTGLIVSSTSLLMLLTKVQIRQSFISLPPLGGKKKVFTATLHTYASSPMPTLPFPVVQQQIVKSLAHQQLHLMSTFT